MQVTVRAVVTAVVNLVRRFDVKGPTDHKVEDMACNDPSEHEGAEGEIACPLEIEIFEHLCELRDLR